MVRAARPTAAQVPRPVLGSSARCTTAEDPAGSGKCPDAVHGAPPGGAPGGRHGGVVGAPHPVQLAAGGRHI
eukprot:1253526-Pyramimonas_sp.AAC.1